MLVNEGLTSSHWQCNAPPALTDRNADLHPCGAADVKPSGIWHQAEVCQLDRHAQGELLVLVPGSIQQCSAPAGPHTPDPGH